MQRNLPMLQPLGLDFGSYVIMAIDSTDFGKEEYEIIIFNYEHGNEITRKALDNVFKALCDRTLKELIQNFNS
jgi:hypothetical protein